MKSFKSASPSLPEGTWRYPVLPEDEGKRLDHFLAEKNPALSRRQWRQLITLGGVWIEGHRVSRVSRPVHQGETFIIYRDGGPIQPLFHLTQKSIIYQDHYLLVVNKPAGIDAQPTPSRYKGTVYAAVRDYIKSLGRPATLGMHTRLDRESSGVMLFSIHPKAHKGVTEVLRKGKVTKAYLALTRKKFSSPWGIQKLPLHRVWGENRWEVHPQGKESVTAYTLIHAGNNGYLWLLLPRTGRSHQLRVFCAHGGAPIVGDVKYGGEKAPRLMLHAYLYALSHPITQKALTFCAPIPSELKIWLPREIG